MLDYDTQRGRLKSFSHITLYKSQFWLITMEDLAIRTWYIGGHNVIVFFFFRTQDIALVIYSFLRWCDKEYVRKRILWSFIFFHDLFTSDSSTCQASAKSSFRSAIITSSKHYVLIKLCLKYHGCLLCLNCWYNCY